MFPDYRAGAERGNRFAMDGRNSLVSFFFPIAQLLDVPTARQSTQVAVKHHQKPLSPVILQPKDPPPGV
jgi:hypothetical protein